MLKNKLILLGGMPASGKTTLGKEIAKSLKIPFLDKDTLCDMYTNFVVAKDTFPNDRSSDLYTKTLRFLEYDILFHVAFEQVSLNLCPILVAPFTSEFQDQEKINKIKEKLKIINPNYELVTILIEASEEKVKDQMIKRNRREDDKKLENWDEYIKEKLLIQEKSKKLVNYCLLDNDPKNLDKTLDFLKENP